MSLKITKEDRAKRMQPLKRQRAEEEGRRADALRPFPARHLFVRPRPVDSDSEVFQSRAKSGPPDRISVSLKGASAAEFRGFYSAALPKYSWKAAGNCWEREHPSSKKTETLCLEASNSSAVIQISEK